MLRLDRGVRQQVSATTAQQGRSQCTVLRFDRQVVNADYDNRVQDEYLTHKYDLRTWSLLSTSHPRRYTVRVTRCHSQDLHFKPRRLAFVGPV